MTKTISISFPEEIEDKLQDIEDTFEGGSRSQVVRRIINEYHAGKNSYQYLTENQNE